MVFRNLESFYYFRVLNGYHFGVFQLAIEKYEEMFPAFTDSRELKLLKVTHFSLLLICSVELNRFCIVE